MTKESIKQLSKESVKQYSHEAFLKVKDFLKNNIMDDLHKEFSYDDQVIVMSNVSLNLILLILRSCENVKLKKEIAEKILRAICDDCIIESLSNLENKEAH